MWLQATDVSVYDFLHPVDAENPTIRCYTPSQKKLARLALDELLSSVFNELNPNCQQISKKM